MLIMLQHQRPIYQLYVENRHIVDCCTPLGCVLRTIIKTTNLGLLTESYNLSIFDVAASTF